MLIDDLKDSFPDLDEYIIDKYLPIYENRYKTYYNANYGINSDDNEIILNLLAHLITTANNQSDGSNVRQVASESVGGVSVSYTTNQLNSLESFFNTTIYGQTYLMLTKRNGGIYFV